VSAFSRSSIRPARGGLQFFGNLTAALAVVERASDGDDGPSSRGTNCKLSQGIVDSLLLYPLRFRFAEATSTS
jgi:hypothetical protein